MEAGGRFADVRSAARDRLHSFHLFGQMPAEIVPEPEQHSHVSFRSMGLTSLPSPLPPGVESLDVSFNQLTSVSSHLPSSLREMNVDHNRLSALPDDLPPYLLSLSARDNQLEDISPEVINRLVQLDQSSLIDLTGNPLSRLTIDRLEQLQNAPGYQGPQIIYSQQAEVQAPRPSAVHSGDAAQAQLGAPARMPEGLPDVAMPDIDHNAVGNLPQWRPLRLPMQLAPGRAPDLGASVAAWMPPTMDGAAIAETSLRWQGFSAERGATDFAEFLDRLRGTDNFASPPFQRSVTEWLSHLEANPEARQETFEIHAEISHAIHGGVTREFLAGWGLQDSTEAGATEQAPQGAIAGLLSDHNTRPGQLPQSLLTLQVAPDTRVSTDLGASVAAWMPPTMGRADITEISLRWQGFSAERGATDFAQFLGRLHGTVNSASPEFQRSVTEWLSQLEANPQLRQDTFDVSEGATVSCEDRVSHTFNAMRQLRLSSDVARGAFDERLPELLALGRSMFRLDQLETIATEHAAAMPNTDELEIYLAYQVMLRERLALPLDTQAMRFPGASDVTEAHVCRAHDRVLEAERQNFANFLSNDWQPWQSVLQRLAPEQHARAQGQLMDAMGEEFSSRLNARLQASGLQHDADAQRIVGPQIQAEITHEIYGRVTRDFLASRGLLSSIEP